MINTSVISEELRLKSVDLINQRVLITNFNNSTQKNDFTLPPNCEGYGRIRHFKRGITNEKWIANPLPIDPVSKALSLDSADLIKAQVFQLASCNWRCWYCFVPYNLLSANPQYAGWLSAKEMIDFYMNLEERPKVIDLTGGQPDLAPEWVLWLMKELEIRNLADEVYLWSDDNLSNDYFFRYLSEADRDYISKYKNYSRVCCFKGFNEESFEFNTSASRDLFKNQFYHFERLFSIGLDLYCYTTFTSPNVKGIGRDIAFFMDELQKIHENLPLRTIPLEVQIFSTVSPRIKSIHEEAIKIQYTAMEKWREELQRRFSSTMLEKNIADVPMRRIN
ncbi:Radical SAM superfamily protein [compost metagenome]